MGYITVFSNVIFRKEGVLMPTRISSEEELNKLLKAVEWNEDKVFDDIWNPSYRLGQMYARRNSFLRIRFSNGDSLCSDSITFLYLHFHESKSLVRVIYKDHKNDTIYVIVEDDYGIASIESF